MRTKHENKAWDQTTSRIKHKRYKNTYSRGVFFINEFIFKLKASYLWTVQFQTKENSAL